MKTIIRKALKYYYDCIIGRLKPFMLKALDRVEPMDISWSAPDTGRCWWATALNP